MHVCRGKKKETYSARMPILMPTLVPVIFPCTTAIFCTNVAHVTAAVICQVRCICVSHIGVEGEEGTSVGLEGGTFEHVEVILLGP